MVDEAGKLPEFDILAFDAGYEHFEETSGRIKECIMQQGPPSSSRYMGPPYPGKLTFDP